MENVHLHVDCNWDFHHQRCVVILVTPSDTNLMVLP